MSKDNNEEDIPTLALIISVIIAWYMGKKNFIHGIDVYKNGDRVLGIGFISVGVFFGLVGIGAVGLTIFNIKEFIVTFQRKKQTAGNLGSMIEKKGEL